MKSSSPSILSLLSMAIGEGTFSLVVGGLPISVFSRLLPSVLTNTFRGEIERAIALTATQVAADLGVVRSNGARPPR